MINEKTILVNDFGDRLIFVDKCEQIENIHFPFSQENMKALKFHTNKNVDFFINKNFTIFNENDETIKNAEVNRRRCPNEYVYYNDIFLLKSKKTEKNLYTEFENDYFNTKQEISFYINSEKYTIEVFMPLRTDKHDDKNYFYWLYKDEDTNLVNYLMEHYATLIFSYIDNRFFSYKNNRCELRSDFDGKIDSRIYRVINEIKLDVPIEKKFNTSLLQNEYYNTFFLEDKKKENVNSIVDMEKQIFIPILNQTMNCVNVLDEINFKIKLRKRENDDWASNVLENSWYEGAIDSSTIKEIGFNDDDIRFQKKSLKKSFIRISFYDTMSRGTQSLLFYATIFLNSNSIFNKYVNGVSNIPCEFTIRNSFDISSSSEGYYLYLFPNLVKKNIPTTIYMKVEFNHAKYGKTIPLVLISDEKFKNGYIDSSAETNIIKKLFDDLYIKINIMYDTTNNRYVWYFNDININDYDNNRITMVLHEPIINSI